jgi:hypothetical protein
VTRPDTFRVLERPRYATAGTDGRYPRPLNEVAAPRVRYALDGRDILSFAVPATSDLRELLTARRVIELKPRGESTSEWLISRVTEAAGPEGNGIFVVECDPIRVILGDAGIIEFVEVGGQSYTNLGGLNGTARNFLRTFAIEHLIRRGITWVVNGTIEPVQQFDFSWDALTPLALIEGIAKETGVEWSLRDNPAQSRYEIDLVERVGGQIEQVEARDGLNILQLQTSRNRERLFTSIRPSGGLAQGAEERANIGWATWRVADVTGDVIEVRPRGGGFGAILEDGQHVGLYLEAADGTFHEIEDSDESDQTLTLETGAGASFAVDDDVQIVADDQGTLLTSLESPSGVASFGFVQGQATGRSLGHRNWIRNPFLSDWPVKPLQTPARADGNQSSATLNFKDLPPNHEVLANDIIVLSAGNFVRVTADATADGSGNITVTVANSVTVTNNQGQTFMRLLGRLPRAWAMTNTQQTPIFDASRHEEINQACNVDGARTADSQVSLKNLPANFKIPAGTSLTVSVFTTQDAVANGSGLVTLKVRPSASATFSDNQAITLRRPALAGDGAVVAGVTRFQTGFLRQNFYFRALKPTDAVSMVARFAGWLDSPNAFNDWGGPADDSTGPRVVFQTSTGSTIQAGNYAEATFDTGFQLYTAQTGATASVASGEYRMAVEPPYSTAQGAKWVLLSTMVYLGTVQPPFVEGSAATRLFQEGQLALLASRQWPATYTVRLSEIVSEWGLDPLSPSLGLGNFIRLRSPSTGVDAILRIVAIEFDPTDPSEKIFTLDSDPERISTLTSKARPRAVFVDVDITVDQDGRARETVLVSESPPVAAPGSERFVVPEGSTPPTGDIVLEVTPLPPRPPSIGLTP